MRAKLIRQGLEKHGPYPVGFTAVRTEDRFLISGLLVAKLHEEAEELASAQGRVKVTDELADIYEVLHSLAVLHGIALHEVERRALNKAEERGPLLTSGPGYATVGLILKGEAE